MSAREEDEVYLREVMDSLVGGVGVFSVDGWQFTAEYLSDGFFDVLGIAREKGMKEAGDFSRLLYGEDILKLHDDVNRCILSGKSTIGEYRFIKLEGGFCWMQVRFSPLEEENGLPRVSAFLMDITESMQERLRLQAKNEELHTRSEIDSLTGVYNHNAFIKYVERRCKRADQGQSGALLMVDVDDFKMVNDVLGHYEGDRVLVQTAKHLNALAADQGFVGRMGGDEFAVFLYSVSQPADAVRFASSVCTTLSQIQVQTGYSVSVGMSLGELCCKAFHQFYTEADQALYAAKRGGKNQYALYAPQRQMQESGQSGSADTYFAEVGWVLDDMDDKVYISDPDSYELLFLNKAMREMIGIEPGDDSWKSQPCYRILNGRQEPCDYCTNHCLNAKHQHYIWQHVSPRTKRRYLCKDQMVRWNNRKARMETAIDITDSDDVARALQSRLEMEDALRRCILEMVSSPNFMQSHRSALRILGEYYGAERTCLYIFQQGQKHELHEWHIERKESLLDEHGKIKPKFVSLTWNPENYDAEPLILDNVEKLRKDHPEQYESLLAQQIFAMYCLPLQHDTVRGQLYVMNPKRHLGDLTVLHLLAVFLGAEVSKWDRWEQQEYELNYDKLTGMRNRTRYFKDMDTIGDATCLGYALIDVDNLKKVNQQFGFEYGNQTVKRIADLVQQAFAEYPVYRFDADAFVVCCKDLQRDAFVQQVQQLKEALAADPIGASIGYVWDDYEMDVRKMNAHAEELMRLQGQEKKEKRPVINERTREYSASWIRQMLEQGNFHVFLQPKMDMHNNVVCGAEALVRLYHPQHGMLSPGKFIPQMEEAGVIPLVDLWVFETVCQTLERWKKEGRKRYPISFNFSRITLLEENLIQRIEDVVQRYDMEKQYLQIEITESIGDMENDIVAQIAQRLHEQEFKLSMDDFGTKYSSISILSLMRFDELKLDRSMVHNLAENEISRKVVKHVVAMCKDIGVRCIAEGVESEEQRDLLIELDCGKAQGYFYSKPIPIAEFEQKYNPI